MSEHLTAAYISSHTSIRPILGIICGSGLSGLANTLDDKIVLRYEDIPGFPRATVAGHAGELVFGYIDSMPCVCMRGRFHFYEGHPMTSVTFPVRVMRLLGVKILLVTNAAGGLNPDYNIGDICIIHDHIGLPLIAGHHPLRGVNNDSFGPRFPSTSDSYDKDLQEIILSCAKEKGLMNIVRPKSVYGIVAGPEYESAAEARLLKMHGADTVGMSTIPEVVVARHCGMSVCALSLVTDIAVTDFTSRNVSTHEEVLKSVKNASHNIESLVKSFLRKDRIGHILDRINLPAISFETSESKDTDDRLDKIDFSRKITKEDASIGVLLHRGLTVAAIVAAVVTIIVKNR